MSNAAHSDDPDALGPGHELELRAVDGELQGEEYRFDPMELLQATLELHSGRLAPPDRSEAYWPDYEFTFSRSYMIGTELAPLTPTGRMRTVAMAIKNQSPECLHAEEGLSAEKSLVDTYKYISGTTSIQGQPMPKSIILPASWVTEELAARMDAVNHPVTQALRQMRQQYGHVIPIEELGKVGFDVILSTQGVLVKDIYKKYTLEFQRIARSGLRHDR